ncbi:MAG: uL15m family ribosomal protein [Candidatus Micrarchaeaceae archaeon]
MVLRIKKRSRKYLGTRRWGAGNIKNRRGSGDKGGVGKGGRKHKFTHIVKYEKERLKHVGFSRPNKHRLEEITLREISEIASKSKEEKPVIELRGYKVLSNGSIERSVVVKAGSFSKKAEEKIKKAGGEALVIK